MIARSWHGRVPTAKADAYQAYSVDAIKRFAGGDYERARYYPEGDDYLLEREPFVMHYDVLFERRLSLLEAVKHEVHRMCSALARSETK